MSSRFYVYERINKCFRTIIPKRFTYVTLIRPVKLYSSLINNTFLLAHNQPLTIVHSTCCSAWKRCAMVFRWSTKKKRWAKWSKWPTTIRSWAQCCATYTIDWTNDWNWTKQVHHVRNRPARPAQRMEVWSLLTFSVSSSAWRSSASCWDCFWNDEWINKALRDRPTHRLDRIRQRPSCRTPSIEHCIRTRYHNIEKINRQINGAMKEINPESIRIDETKNSPYHKAVIVAFARHIRLQLCSQAINRIHLCSHKHTLTHTHRLQTGPAAGLCGMTRTRSLFLSVHSHFSNFINQLRRHGFN